MFKNHKTIHFGNKHSNPGRPSVPPKPVPDIVYTNPKILAVVVVYNRFENLVRWINCWNQSEQCNATFLVIHNYDSDTVLAPWENLCNENKVEYYARPNVGFDIGAFQDMVKDRLRQDLSWNILFWATDDAIPMKKDWLTQYIQATNQSEVGVTCMHLSSAIKPHIRTTGFCIKKSIAELLYFPIDPITTKDQCYNFEFINTQLTFLNQILLMKKKVIQIMPIEQSLIWDSTQANVKDRWSEHYSEFTYV